MTLLEGIRIALQQIWAHKLKSAFTLIGVVIGITFLIAVITVVEGVNRYVQDRSQHVYRRAAEPGADGC
jgi:putative ABC transport system permease protein